MYVLLLFVRIGWWHHFTCIAS